MSHSGVAFVLMLRSFSSELVKLSDFQFPTFLRTSNLLHIHVGFVIARLTALYTSFVKQKSVITILTVFEASSTKSRQMNVHIILTDIFYALVIAKRVLALLRLEMTDFELLMFFVIFSASFLLLLLKEKGRYLTQFYDKSPYTHGKSKKQRENK